MSDDPLWSRVKAQTKPLTKLRQQDQSVKNTTPNSIWYPERPIWDAGFGEKKQAKPTAYLSPERADTHQRVRRGRVKIDLTVDLHGLSEAKAKEKILLCLLSSELPKIKTVLVITGKGDKGQGVLRTALPNWLKTPEFSGLVHGFAQAHKRHGGKGAWYLFLRNRI